MSGTASIEAAAWLSRLRAGAKARFELLGIPKPTDEDWRQTDVRRVAPFAATPLDPPKLRPDAVLAQGLAALLPYRAVLVNGRWDESLSTLTGAPAGVRAGSLMAALAEAGEGPESDVGSAASSESAPFVALNTTLFADGLLVRVAAGVRAATPLHIVHIAVPGADTFALKQYLDTNNGGGALGVFAALTGGGLDNFSVVKGAHQLRMGFNFRFYQHNDQRGQPGGVNVTPVLSFSRTIRPPAGFDIPRTMAAQDSNNLQQSINELLGIPARLTQVFMGDLRSDQFLPFRSGDSVTLWAQGQRLKQYNFYIQDEWKVRRNVTLNYGARWELNPAPTEAGGRVYVPQGNFEGPELVSFVPAKRCRQRRSLMTATGLPSSAGVIIRPRMPVTPSTSKSRPLTYAPSTASLLPLGDRSKLWPAHANVPSAAAVRSASCTGSP